MRKISESAWGDMMRRGSGEVIRTEDDVNNMDFDTFADYIKDNYSEKGNWFAIRESDDRNSKQIEIDIIYGEEIDLSFNVIDGELYNILVQGNKNYVDIPGLKEIFNVNVLGSSTFSVVEKDWSKSNNTFVKLIEFYLKKKTNESAWGDMMRRGSGENIRTEDDPKNMSPEEFFEYLKNNYELVKKDSHSTDIGLYDDGNRIIVPIVETPFGILEHKLSIYIDYKKNGDGIFIYGEADKYKDILINGGVELIKDNEVYYIVLDKDKTINEMFLICLDLLIDGIEPEKRNIRKKVIMNESAWGDMMRRGAGEEVRGEDIDFLNSVKSDIRFFAIDIVYADLYKNSIDGFKEFMSKSYKNNFYDSKTHENVGKKMVKDIVIHVEANWNKGKNYESQVNEEINKEEEKVKKLGFVKEPGKSIEKTLNDWWDSYPYKEDLMNEVNLDLNGEEKYEDPDDMWNDSDYLTQIETYLKERINESAWGDMMRRGSGEEIRDEDKIPQELQKPLAAYIEMFASYYTSGSSDYTVGSYPDFKAFVKNFRNAPRILALEYDMNDLLDYITKDHYYNVIHPVILDTIDKINHSVDVAVDTIIDSLKDSNMNESAWGDMMRRGSGEDNRTEDEILSDNEINSLNQFTSMYCRRERGNYIQNHIVPPPPSCRKENDYERFIKYIEDRRDEDLFTNVGDYDKIIEYIKKNWKRLDIDKYIKKCIFSPDMMKGKKLLECEGVPCGATPANVGGMGAAYFPGPNGEPGSGDLPSPTGIVYHQVAPYTTFLKQIKKKKKKTKKFRKEDEPCVHSPNAKVYDYVDDFREYVDRTYNNIDRR